jgi:hypothetical protein
VAYTYTAAPVTGPGATSQQLRDAVRLMAGDTDATDAQLQDAEVDWFIATENSPRLAAHAAALALQGKYSRWADQAEDDLKMAYSQRAKAYASLAETLLSRATQDQMAQATPGPIAGGLTDWSAPGVGGQSPDVDADTGQNLPGSYFTRESPTTRPPPGGQ